MCTFMKGSIFIETTFCLSIKKNRTIKLREREETQNKTEEKERREEFYEHTCFFVRFRKK